MNDVKSAHPNLNQLAAFAQGRLTEAEIAELSAHLSACPECVATVEASGDDTLISLLRAADTEHEPEAPAKPAEAETLALPGDTSETRRLPAELATHGRYRVQELLGVGGMGAVYKAEHLLMERPVALKLISHSLTRNPGMVERFRREVKTAGQLRHPNIVMAYDAEQAGDSHFLVMEYVEGKSLARVVTEQGPLPVRVACDYIRQAACGLAYAHERGMVHRDIKPQNLMLTPDGQVKILDFGLARFAMEAAPTGALLSAPIPDTVSSGSTTGSLTQAGAVMGTPDYIAPEQAKDAHTADIRADIYSLGCTLYDLLAGHAPFPEGTVLDKVLAHAERSPEPLTAVRPDVPPTLARVVERMMAKDPAKRYQRPAEIEDVLKPFTAAAPAQPRRPVRWLIAAAFLGAAALVLGGWIIYVQTDKGEFVVEASDKNIEAIVNEKGVTIRDTKSGREYVLKVGSRDVRTGEYQIVSVLPDGVEIEGGSFTVKRGGVAVATAKVSGLALQERDRSLFQGTWRVVSASVKGRRMIESSVSALSATAYFFKDSRVNWKANVAPDSGDPLARALNTFGDGGTFQLDPTKSPKTIDMRVLRKSTTEPNAKPYGHEMLGIYRFNGEALELCVAIDPDLRDEELPKQFDSVSGKFTVYLVLKHVSDEPSQDGLQSARIAAAAKAAEAYLKKLDGGEYAALWDHVATWAKEHGHTKENVVQGYESVSKVSGKLISRTPADKPKYLTAPGSGLPDGEYVLFGYNSRFERMDPAVEQLGLMLEKDGQWRSILYARLMSDTPATSSVRAQGPAVVGPAQAKFTIPVPEKKEWSWHLAVTPANEEEYHWGVKVTNNGKSYSFGYSLYKMGGQKPASGTLQELLNAGQVNVWAATKDGASIVEGEVQARAEGNNVVVTINDKKLLAQLFSTKPPVVEFESGLPGDEKVATRKVDVTYEPADKDAKIEAATKATDAWLKVVDAGDYAKAWEQCAQSVRDPISKQNFIFIYEGSSKATGKLKSRTFLGREYTTKLPGTPDGEHVVFTYKSSFENGTDATQQVVATLEKDGVWRVSQYVTFPAAAAKTEAKDLELLQGTWNIDTMEWGGKSLPKELMSGYKFVFADNKLTWDGAIGMQSRGGKVTAIDGSFPCDFKIDPGKEPKQIDITLQLKQGDRTVLGIYEIKGDTLKVCYFGSNTGRRPAEFSTKGGLNIGYIVLTRAKK